MTDSRDTLDAVTCGDRGGVFAGLVGGDRDVVGLVAYAIHKRAQVDWETAFREAFGRLPDAAEDRSFLVGEGTPRRLAAYRLLAEDRLSRRPAPTTAGAEGGGARPDRHWGIGIKVGLACSAVGLAIVFLTAKKVGLIP